MLWILLQHEFRRESHYIFVHVQIQHQSTTVNRCSHLLSIFFFFFALSTFVLRAAEKIPINSNHDAEFFESQTCTRRPFFYADSFTEHWIIYQKSFLFRKQSLFTFGHDRWKYSNRNCSTQFATMDQFHGNISQPNSISPGITEQFSFCFTY